MGGSSSYINDLQHRTLTATTLAHLHSLTAMFRHHFLWRRGELRSQLSRTALVASWPIVVPSLQAPRLAASNRLYPTVQLKVGHCPRWTSNTACRLQYMLR